MVMMIPIITIVPVISSSLIPIIGATIIVNIIMMVIIPDKVLDDWPTWKWVMLAMAMVIASSYASDALDSWLHTRHITDSTGTIA